MARARQTAKLDGLFIVAGMSLALMAFSFVRVIGDAGSAALGRGVLEAVLAQPIWGTRLGSELVQFAAGLVLIHLILAVVSWIAAGISYAAWPNGRNSQRVLAVFWFVIFAIWILAANAAWYPRSSLGAPYEDFVNGRFGGISVFAVMVRVSGLTPRYRRRGRTG